MAEKTRYSDAELEEFRAIIMEKLELAQRDYDRVHSEPTCGIGAYRKQDLRYLP